MSGEQEPQDANTWHGQRIVGEDELSFQSDAQAKRRRRRRQNAVFGALSALVAVVLVVALLVFTQKIQLPGQRQTPAAADQQQPIANPDCPQRDFTYLDPSEVEVRVLNAGGQNGLGGSTAQKLSQRGFQIALTTSAVSDYADTVGAVVSGPQGYAQALTLQRHLDGAVYVFDKDKRGAQVDFEIGAKFAEMTKTRRLDKTPGPLQCAASAAKK
ncbi:LytR C-terminal domain-containing protein [Glutamicibacter creatinolyticus]|uniref:LytR C-terminal domain-containing protein n=1 Tax=Glutamicibacter creatinolyticus TaxID=162496 RepID=UPI003B98210D